MKVALQALANLSTGSPAVATAIWHDLFPDLFMSLLSLHPGIELIEFLAVPLPSSMGSVIRSALVTLLH